MTSDQRKSLNNQFDELTRNLAQSLTRRGPLKKLSFALTGTALGAFRLAIAAEAAADSAPPAKTSATIPWSQLGAKAGAGYNGDGLAVVPTAEGAHLRCVFQRLEGEATREGLWLRSTATNTVNDRFRIVAAAVARDSSSAQHGLRAARLDAPRIPCSGRVAID